MTTMNEERARVVDAMCMTWRHDFGLDRKDNELGSCGMTDTERDALRRKMGQLYDHHFAAWQRAQWAVPDVSAMAMVLSDRSADACNIDRTDNWAMYGQEYIEDVRAMLAAAPVEQKPAGIDYRLKFECLVEHAKRQDKVIADMRYDENIRRYYDDGAVWFWSGDGSDDLESLACPVVINAGDLRSMLANSTHQPVEQSAMVPEGWRLVPIDPTPAMVESAVSEADRQETKWRYDGAAFWNAMLSAAPANPAERQEQGEVQRLREALEAIATCTGDDQARDCAMAALAASTGQEVGE